MCLARNILCTSSLSPAMLYLFYPGEYILGALLYLLALLALRRDLRKARLERSTSKRPSQGGAAVTNAALEGAE